MDEASAPRKAAAPLILINGYPGVGKDAVAAALHKRISHSRLLNNHLLIEPVEALLSLDDPGYRALRKALRTPIFDCIAHNSALRSHTIIATYYQETLTDRPITLYDFYNSAQKSGRILLVIILECSEEENMRRISARSARYMSKLRDAAIMKDIRQNHFVFSFYDADFRPPDLRECRLNVDGMSAEDAAGRILRWMEGLHDQSARG